MDGPGTVSSTTGGPGGTRTGAYLIDRLRGLDLPRKQSVQWVSVPRCIAFSTPAVEVSGCVACALRTWVGKDKGMHPSDLERSHFSHSRGNSLKVLLTVYRWGRPYGTFRQGETASYESYVHHAVTSVLL